MKREKNPPI